MCARRPRGSALLAALIVIGVLATVTAATLLLAGVSKGDSARDARSLSQTSCVEAAREYVLGRLHVFGLDPTTITLDQAIQVETGTRHIYTGHMRTVSGGQPQGSYAVINSVTTAAPGALGGSNNNRDIANVIGGGGAMLGARGYRVVVACTDPLAGDMELEFTFKYGL